MADQDSKREQRTKKTKDRSGRVKRGDEAADDGEL
jgi:hypothetical protein